jgi:pimeloyl-ACP methyl ester carboxylesterase
MGALARLGIPIWGEGRFAFEHAALLRDPVLRGAGVPRGDGAPVLLVPGFMAGDPSLTLMARWLRRIGYGPARVGMRVNADCAARAIDRLEALTEALAERSGRRVAVVGQSRGGSLARVLAVRRPDLVDRIVSLGSPLRDQLAVHPLVHAQVLAVGLLGTAGIPGLFSRSCLWGECCAEAREQVAGAFPADVAFVSVYSRSDGIVDWRACLDPAARCVEVRSSHCGMAVSADVYRVVAEALAPAPAQAAAVAARAA